MVREDLHAVVIEHPDAAGPDKIDASQKALRLFRHHPAAAGMIDDPTQDLRLIFPLRRTENVDDEYHDRNLVLMSCPVGNASLYESDNRTTKDGASSVCGAVTSFDILV